MVFAFKVDRKSHVTAGLTRDLIPVFAERLGQIGAAKISGYFHAEIISSFTV